MSIRSLYDVAREVCHEFGMPWFDPRTGKAHPPPKRKPKLRAKRIAKKQK